MTFANTKLDTFLVIGAPLSGKGTLIDNLPYDGISSGDVFRAMVKYERNGELPFAQVSSSLESDFNRLCLAYGEATEEMVRRGTTLVDDDFTVHAISTYLGWVQNGLIADIKAPGFTDNVGADGFPRSVPQVDGFEPYINVNAIIYLDTASNYQALLDRATVRYEQALEKGLDARDDDANPEFVMGRQRDFEDVTLPIVDEYDSKKLIKINAFQTPQQVAAQAKAGLEMLITDELVSH